MTVTATEPLTAITESAFANIPALRPADRCDATTLTVRAGSGIAGQRVACGAQAYVTALLPSGGTLLFCAHHGHEKEAGLVEQGAVIRDDSATLQQDTKPGASA